MSKIAKKPIVVPDGVTVELGEREIKVSGKQGSISLPMMDFVKAERAEGGIIFSPLASHKQARANWGTIASLTKNAISGVSSGFTKRLEIEGIGFRASMDGQTLVLAVGFTHPVKFVPSEGIKISVEKNAIVVTGSNKQSVGQAAAQIRKIKKPEPYKGKGIHYAGEVIRRKAGKKVAGTGTGAA